MRRSLAVTVIVALTMMFAGCGGIPGSSALKSDLNGLVKSGVVAAADELCSMSASSLAQQRARLAQLREIPAPPQDTARVAAIWNAAALAINIRGREATRHVAIARYDHLARAYGLKVCGQAGHLP